MLYVDNNKQSKKISLNKILAKYKKIALVYLRLKKKGQKSQNISFKLFTLIVEENSSIMQKKII